MEPVKLMSSGEMARHLGEPYYRIAHIIRSRDMYTLPLSIMNLRGRFPVYVDYPTVFAASFMATIPTLIVFFSLQRHFVSGIAAGAVKG